MEDFMGFLTGKTAIITGAGRAVLSDGRCGSIGYGIATAYAKEGANLVITGRNVKKLEDAKEELERLYGIQVLIVQADVNAGADNEAVVANVVKQAIDTFGSIDVLINNAQASASGVPLAEHTTEQFDLALYSGLYAAFYYMKACYPYLAKAKGSVINFASGAGLFGNFGQCAYAAAKEGIRGLTRVAATEWAKDGINVNIICPLAWTAQLEQFEKAYPDAFKANVKMPPAGHYGDSELEIGRVCVQLASPDFKYLTGETLTLEGGMGLRP
jgi:NAD(P)-dependent dehydrogenase (short-subunit alcohol dehydrogenase family)